MPSHVPSRTNFVYSFSPLVPRRCTKAPTADVIAVLESNTGEIAWRQVLDDRGGLGAILLARSERESIFAVSADGSAVRSFRVATGLLEV